MAYEKVGWKNWPLKLTKISAENLDHMDSQIKANADNIGDIAKIADIGDGTLAGAAAKIKETVNALNSEISEKQETITGAATTITSSNLTANRALISNVSGKVTVSAVTSTELGYLDGAASNIQTQINDVKDDLPITGNITTTGVSNMTIKNGKYCVVNGIMLVTAQLHPTADFAQYNVVARLDGTPVTGVYFNDMNGNEFHINKYNQLCIYQPGGLKAGTVYEIKAVTAAF